MPVAARVRFAESRSFSMSSRRVTVLCALLLAGTGRTARAQTSTGPIAYQEVVSRLRTEIAREMTDKHLRALSIALVDDQQVVWAQGFGPEDAAGLRPATAHTIYRVGSVSKLFTDLAVMRMVDAGRMNLDAPITDVLPDFHPKNSFGGDITLRQLMSHRSGLTREPPIGHYFDQTTPTLASTVDSLNGTQLVFAPGSHFKYSNAGVATVGRALEAVAGEAFAEHVKHSVLEPLGMQESAFVPEAKISARLAEGHMWSYDGLDFAAPTFQLGEAPAGSMYSSVSDLSRLLSMVFADGRVGGGQLISQQSLKTMLIPQSGGEYGLGFSLEPIDGHKAFGHGGEIYGFTAQLSGLPDEKLGVVVVTNTDDVNAVTEHLADDALRMMLAQRGKGPMPEEIRTELLPPEMARAAVGVYRSRERDLRLEEREGHLVMSKSTGGNLAELKKKGTDLITDSRLSWWSMGVALRGDSLIARGDTYQRVASPADRPDVPPALQPGTPWKDYIGEYGWEFDKLFVFEEGGQLRVLVEWFDFEPLERMTGDRFVLPDRGFYQAEQVVFARDPQGAVTGVTIGAVLFPKLSLAADGKSFRVKLVRPTGELRREAQRSRPPAEAAGLRSAKLVEVTPAAGVHLDVRYATSDNFMGAPLYGEPRVFLERGAALALRRVAERLQAAGYGLILYDGYRPWSVTKMMWDGTPEAQRLFVADPAKGSRHNRGCAVDLSLFDRKTGRAVTMPSGYDEMTERAYAFYPGGTERQRAARDVLRYAMEKEGFAVNPTEWWHFDYKDWATYAIGTVSLDDLRAKKGGVGPSR